jgi:1,4-dihydroxy-2-naphthoate octaprenyltransferase
MPLEQIAVPSRARIYLTAIRPELLALTVGPALATWLNHPTAAPAWTRGPAWAAMLGVFFLHAAAFLMNDVQDHVGGADRLNRGRGSRVIQNGWTTAAAMKFWARVNFGAAVLCGVPACLAAPLEISLTCLAALGALAVLTLNFGTRRGAGDLALVALFGPLLTLGVAYASFGAADLTDVALGLAFGCTAAWVLQLRQFENLFRATPESFRTFLGHLNFDGARVSVVAEGILLLALLPAAGVVVRVPLLSLLILPLFGLPVIRRVHGIFRATSPLSSSLQHSARAGLIAHVSFTAWWLLSLGTLWR